MKTNVFLLRHQHIFNEIVQLINNTKIRRLFLTTKSLSGFFAFSQECNVVILISTHITYFYCGPSRA